MLRYVGEAGVGTVKASNGRDIEEATLCLAGLATQLPTRRSGASRVHGNCMCL